VATEIVADDEKFIPKYCDEDGICCELVANIPVQEDGSQTIRLPHRATVLVDCGFSMTLKPGWRVDIEASEEYALQGLFVRRIGKEKRMKLVVTVLGHVNPVRISHGDKLAHMTVSPVSRIEWMVNNE
jgi:hypothetical protein